MEIFLPGSDRVRLGGPRTRDRVSGLVPDEDVVHLRQVAGRQDRLAGRPRCPAGGSGSNLARG